MKKSQAIQYLFIDPNPADIFEATLKELLIAKLLAESADLKTQHGAIQPFSV